MSTEDVIEPTGATAESEVPSTSNDYSGYKPVVFADLAASVKEPTAPDVPDGDEEEEEAPDPNIIGKISLAVVCVLLLLCIIVLIPPVACRLRLCNNWDRASRSDPGFRVFSFIFPYQFVWGALTAGVGGVLIVFIHLFTLNTKGTGSNRVTNAILTSQKCAKIFLLYEYFCELIFSFPLFILIGFGVSWFTAGCFLLGAFIALAAGWFGMHVAAFGSIRVAAATETEMSFPASFRIIYQAASAAGLLGISLGVAGVSFAYIAFRNIRGLLGFAAGVSYSSLISNVASGIYAVATETARHLVTSFEADLPVDDPRNPVTTAARVADHVEGGVSIANEFFESFVTALVAAAVLGASLPYVQQNRYALCMYNHFHIDFACIAYAVATVKSSFAAQICRTNSLWQTFPSIFFMESNSIFIAVPFIVAILGTVTTLALTVRVFFFKLELGAVRRRNLQKAAVGARVQVAISSLIFFLGIALTAFTLFGPQSNFQRRHSRNIYPRRELRGANDTERCMPIQNINALNGANLPPLDASLGPFRATNLFGAAYPVPSSIPWRVLVALVLGQVLALLLQALSVVFTDTNYPLTKGVARMGECSTEDVIIQGLGSALASTALPFMLILGTVLGASALLGSYGVGLAAVSMIASSGTTFVFNAFETLGSSAGGAMKINNRPEGAQDIVHDLGGVGHSFQVGFRSTAAGASVVTTFALISELIRMTDLIPSPMEIVGNITTEPTRHISTIDNLSGTTPNVVVSVFMGVLLPVVFVALPLLGMQRTAYAILTETRAQFRETPELLTGTSETMPRIRKCVRICAKYALFEMILPLFIVLVVPLMVGFGLGQRALVGFLLGATGSSYLVGMFVLNASSCWRNAKRLVETGYFGEESGPGSQWYRSVTKANEVGVFLQRTSASSLSIAMKLITVSSIFVVPFMQPDDSRWYNGLAILGVAAVMTIVLLLISHMYQRKTQKKAKQVIIDGADKSDKSEDVDDYEKVSRLPVSPFYEEGMTVPRRRIAPRSALAHARVNPSSMTVVPEQMLRNQNMNTVNLNDDKVE